MSDPIGRIDLTGAGPNELPAVDLDDAIHRVVGFCCTQGSGWRAFDLCGAQARELGHFDAVAPWSLLWADALAGRVTVNDIEALTHESRLVELAQLIAAVPTNRDLAQFTAAERDALGALCGFRQIPGIKAAKVTKVAALYRPQAVPILDGLVSRAFGYGDAGFSDGSPQVIQKRITNTINRIANFLARRQELLAHIRHSVHQVVPDIQIASDVRLLDIILWTSQDDSLRQQEETVGVTRRRLRDPWLALGRAATASDYVTSRLDPIPVNGEADPDTATR